VASLPSSGTIAAMIACFSAKVVAYFTAVDFKTADPAKREARLHQLGADPMTIIERRPPTVPVLSPPGPDRRSDKQIRDAIRARKSGAGLLLDHHFVAFAAEKRAGVAAPARDS
jgi:hypothetical protein